jgi:MFS family permease
LMVVGALLLLTVREPERSSGSGMRAHVQHESLLNTLRRLARIRTLWTFAAGFILLNMAFQGYVAWMPAFLMRVHGLQSAQMGAVFGAIVAGGAISSLVAGPATDALAKRGERWRLYYFVASVVLAVPLLAASSLVSSLTACVTLSLAYSMVGGGLASVAPAVYLTVAPHDARGVVTALMTLCIFMLGSGVAIPLLGFVNDLLKAIYGDQSLRYTLLLGPVFMAGSGVFMYMAGRTVEHDAERSHRGLA